MPQLTHQDSSLNSAEPKSVVLADYTMGQSISEALFASMNFGRKLDPCVVLKLYLSFDVTRIITIPFRAPGGIRTHVDFRQKICSHSPSATRAPVHFLLYPFFNASLKGSVDVNVYVFRYLLHCGGDHFRFQTVFPCYRKSVIHGLRHRLQCLFLSLWCVHFVSLLK